MDPWEHSVDILKSGLDANHVVVTFILQSLAIVFHTFFALLSILWNIGCALISLLIQGLVEISIVIPKVVAIFSSLLFVLGYGATSVFSFFFNAASGLKLTCRSGAELFVDVALQIQNLCLECHDFLHLSADAIHAAFDSTLLTVNDISSCLLFLRSSFSALLASLVYYSLSFLVFLLFLPIRVIISIPLTFYLLGFGLPFSYYCLRVLWAWMQTQNHITRTRLFQEVFAFKVFVEAVILDPLKTWGIIAFDFMLIRILNPFKLWAIVASQQMVDAVYIPIFRDLTFLFKFLLHLYASLVSRLFQFFVSTLLHSFKVLYRRASIFCFWLFSMIALSIVAATHYALYPLNLLLQTFFEFVTRCTTLIRGFLCDALARVCRCCKDAVAFILSLFWWRQGQNVNHAGAVPFPARIRHGDVVVFQQEVAPTPASTSNVPGSSSRESDPTILKTLRRQLTDERERHLCVVCQDGIKSMLILPCRHACLCRPCAVEIITNADVNQRLCPLCRQLMHEVIHVYI